MCLRRFNKKIFSFTCRNQNKNFIPQAFLTRAIYHRSESSPTNADELKQIKSLISDLQDDLKDSQTQIDDKLESNITDLHSRFNQMENRFDRWLKEMKEVGVHHETSLLSMYI